MHRLLWIALPISVLVRAQSFEDAAELLRKVRSVAESTRNWRAEVVVTSQMSGLGTNLRDEVRTKIAAQSPLRLSRQNSGADQTIFVCDGSQTFYSGDGHSYYRGDVRTTPQCDFPLSKFYELEDSPTSLSVVGQDRVRLAGTDRECVLIRATWKRDTVNIVRTMCIDPDQALILRDVKEGQDEKTGIRSVETTMFIEFESDPAFPRDTFLFSIPPGAFEAKPPI